jgi:hypothetical protein
LTGNQFFFNKSTVFFVRYSYHVDQSHLNSFTASGGHDCQLLNKLLWRLASSLISVCFQRFIAIKIAEIFCSVIGHGIGGKDIPINMERLAESQSLE